MHDYSGGRHEISGAEISELSALLGQLEIAKQEEDEASKNLKEKTKRVTELEQHQIPELMLAMNTKKHETASGVTLSLKESIRCSIPVANRKRCMQWLVDNGHSALIKNTVFVSFNISQNKDASELVQRLENEHHHVSQEQRVEPSTMRAFIKVQLEKGVDFPMDMFGAFQQQKAVMKVKRQPQSI